MLRGKAGNAEDNGGPEHPCGDGCGCEALVADATLVKSYCHHVWRSVAFILSCRSVSVSEGDSMGKLRNSRPMTTRTGTCDACGEQKAAPDRLATGGRPGPE